MSRAIQIDLLLVPLYDYRTDSLCSGYTVNFFAAGTTTPKNVWTEVGKVTPVTTRTLSSSGTVQVYGDGIYKIVVLDTDAATVYTWDYVKAQANTFTVQSKSGTYTATADDDIILVNTTAAGVTINLATVVGFTHPLTIKLAAGANDVTIDAHTTQTIDGELTITLSTSDDSATLYPDVTGEVWYRANKFSGLTTSITELNLLDGLLATAAELNQLVDERPAFVNVAAGSPTVNETVFKVSGLDGITEDTWRSIGPTGGGAVYTWTALDGLPTDIDWIRVRLDTSITADAATATYSVYGRKNGSETGVGGSTKLQHIMQAAAESAGDLSEVTIPVSSRKFDLLWYQDDAASWDTSMFLVGYGWNP